MKQFLKIVLCAAAFVAAIAGLALLDDKKGDRYISVYDSDDGPF